MKQLSIVLLCAALFACGNDDPSSPQDEDENDMTPEEMMLARVTEVVPAFADANDDWIFLDQIIHQDGRTIMRFGERIAFAEDGGAPVDAYQCDNCWLTGMTLRDGNLYVFQEVGHTARLLRIDVATRAVVGETVLDGFVDLGVSSGVVFRDDEVLYASADTQEPPFTWSIRRALLDGGTRTAIAAAEAPRQLVIESDRRLYWVEDDWTLHTLILDQTSGSSTNLVAGSGIVGASNGAIVRIGAVDGAAQTFRFDSGLIPTPFLPDSTSESVYQVGSRADAESNTGGYFAQRDSQASYSIFRPHSSNDAPVFADNDEIISLYGVFQWNAAVVIGSDVFVPTVSTTEGTIRVVRVDVSQAAD